MLMPLKSTPLVLVMISSMSEPVCNSFHARQVKSKNNYFLVGYAFLIPVCTGLLERRRSGLGLLKSTFNGENFVCRLSWSISSGPAVSEQFTLKMCVATRNRKKFTKTQSHSRSLMWTLLRSSSPVLVMLSSMCVPICNHFHARQANSCKIMSFRGSPLSPIVRGCPSRPAA